MYFPITGIGLGQHSPTLWREHMAALSRMRSIATPGHGFGTASGTSSFDVTGSPSSTQPCITYVAHPDLSGPIYMGSPVVISDDMLVSFQNFWPNCVTTMPLTISNIRGPILRGGASVGWPNMTSTTGDCTIAVWGDFSACAVSLTTTHPGALGQAFIANRCAGYVLRTDDVDGSGGNYAHQPTPSQNSIAAGKFAKISGGLVRRHCGLWKILSSNPVLDDDAETDLGIDLCILERQPHKHRWFIADIDGIDESESSDYIKAYAWHESGSSTVDEESTDFAYNLVEEENGDEDDEYVSDQLFQDIGDWSMLQARGKAFMRLDIDNLTGEYSARFSRASQFMGDCWDL